MSQQEKERWNQVADRYQATIGEYETGYPDLLLDWLRQRGAVFPGEMVADIGCGAGKYAVRFAKAGCRLLVTDIAENMMRYTLENLRPLGGLVESSVCDWEEVDLAQQGWEHAVDLAFASMTPAIQCARDVDKLTQMSRRFCFVSRFLSMDNQLYRDAARRCGIDLPAGRNLTGESLDLVRHLIETGQFPEIRCMPYGWENRLTPADAFGQIMGSELGETLRQRGLEPSLRQALQEMAQPDGLVRETVDAATIWIFWDVRRGRDGSQKESV